MEFAISSIQAYDYQFALNSQSKDLIKDPCDYFSINKILVRFTFLRNFKLMLDAKLLCPIQVLRCQEFAHNDTAVLLLSIHSYPVFLPLPSVLLLSFLH